MKRLILTLIICATFNILSAQTITLTFLKNCVAYSDTKFADELYKSGFYLANKKMDVVSNKSLVGGRYFSNDKERKLTNGEISVIANKSEGNKIVELSFVSNDLYKDNYNSLYNQIKSQFKKEKSFYSLKYKADIDKYTFNNYFYYIYLDDNTPCIIISNARQEESYFTN
jgi:hypothetical protein